MTAHPVDHPPHIAEPTRGNGEVILVADDDPDVLSLLSEILTDAGYQARTADGGFRAVIEARESPPALLLLDVMMPGMDGFAVCNELQASTRTRRVPVIFLTALSGTADRVRGLTCAGAVDWVSKPFDTAELLARIHVALYHRGLPPSPAP